MLGIQCCHAATRRNIYAYQSKCCCLPIPLPLVIFFHFFSLSLSRSLSCFSKESCTHWHAFVVIKSCRAMRGCFDAIARMLPALSMRHVSPIDVVAFNTRFHFPNILHSCRCLYFIIHAMELITIRRIIFSRFFCDKNACKRRFGEHVRNVFVYVSLMCACRIVEFRSWQSSSSRCNRITCTTDRQQKKKNVTS